MTDDPRDPHDLDELGEPLSWRARRRRLRAVEAPVVDVDAERADEDAQWRRYFGDEPVAAPEVEPMRRTFKVGVLCTILAALDDTHQLPPKSYEPLARQIIEQLDPSMITVHASQIPAHELRRQRARSWWSWLHEPDEHDRHGGMPT